MAFVGTLKITALDARIEKSNALINLDTPDPYVKMTMSNRQGKSVENRTKNKSDTYTPVWNETFFFKNVPLTTMSIVVMDKDTFTSDDKLCDGFIDLQRALGRSRFANNVVVDLRHDGKSQGTARFDLEFVPQGSVDITVVNATGVTCPGETPDPYVVVKYDGTKHKTEHVNNTNNPTWNAKFAFGSHDLQDIKKGVFKSDVVEFTVYDHDRFTSDDKIGEAKFELIALADKSEQRVALPLTGKNATGQLYIIANLTVETM
ncbi:C2 domain [Carpediemonas membranifera]|uniref:C2 domain n=1 Tax=Carpediemonas membranifera TaxID=201153 RepID=A0A8J6E531_9EUKA|nr:C2 domain [Carpediemonas membranifera]|eukprot:KAG9395242.1 C2 domain [Carpediemonas membranifera]